MNREVVFRTVLCLLVVCAPVAHASARPKPAVLTSTNESMLPALPVGAELGTDWHAFDRAAPRVGDIVVFNPPRAAEVATEDDEICGGGAQRRGAMCARPPKGGYSDVWFLKRVVGVAGDRLSLRRGRFVRNGRPLAERYARTTDCTSALCDLRRTITVPRGHVFLAGDNRAWSFDSRQFGPVARDRVLARVVGCVPPAGEQCRMESAAKALRGAY